MALAPGTIRLPEIATSPAAPPPGYAFVYIKTDNVIYLKDSSGVEVPFGSASSITGLTGDVSAVGPGVVMATVNTVGGVTAANIATAVNAYLAATASNTPNTLVKRDGSGNFSANIITANLTGNATTATTAVTSTNFTGSLSGDVTGTQSATVVATVGGSSAANVHSAELAANAATPTNTASTIVKRDASGNFAANLITANLSGNATTSTSFTGSLAGDVTGTQGATVVSFVGTSSAANIHSAELAANAATSANTASTIVKRDGSGNFSAGTITASLTGNVTGNVSGSSASFTGSLVGDVTGTQGATVVATVGGSSAANIHSAELAANAATPTNTASTIVQRDASGNFSAGTITASLTGNVTGNVSGTAANVTGIVAIANGGTNSSTALVNNRIMKSSGGQIVEAAAITANKALASNASGIPVASTTTDTELGYVSGVTSSIQAQLNAVTGSSITALTGDVSATGPGSVAATVNSVGGSSAANIHSAELAANAATSANTASTIVKRDASGNIFITQVNGVVPEAHASRHNPGGADALATAAPIANLSANTTNAAGSASSYSLSDHSHAISTGVVSTQTPDQTNAAGSSANLARADHVHNIPAAAPVQIGTANTKGSAASFALSDHIHDHGAQTSGTLHAIVTHVVNGFMSAADKIILDAATPVNTASTLVSRDSSGNFAAGTITANLTGTATNATNATTAVNFTGTLAGDVTGTQSATVVATVGGSSAANIHSAELAANAATNLNTVSTIAKRDSNGDLAFRDVTERNALMSGYIELAQSTAPATPAATKVDIFNELSNGFSRLRVLDETGYKATLLRDSFFLIKNVSGSTLSKGKAVYPTGSNGGLLTVDLAKADSKNTVPCIGLMAEDVANNGFGRVLALGILSGFDTSAFTAGQTVYLSDTTAGALISTKPTSPHIWQRIGVILTSNAITGSMEVRPFGTHGEESGTYSNDYQIGDGIAGNKSVSFNAAFLAALAWNPGSAQTITLPPNLVGAGTYLSDTGGGVLGWTNPVTNIDGGSPSSNYTPSQSLSGGTP